MAPSAAPPLAYCENHPHIQGEKPSKKQAPFLKYLVTIGQGETCAPKMFTLPSSGIPATCSDGLAAEGDGRSGRFDVGKSILTGTDTQSFPLK